MQTKTQREVKTRINKSSPQVVTQLVINWEGMTDDDIQDFAESAITIKLQSIWKKKGIPAGTHTVNAVEFKKGLRAKREPQSAESIIAKMDPEARKQFILEQMRQLGLA